MEKNLLGIIEAARRNGMDVEFATGAEALQQIFRGCEGGEGLGA
jgi:hypothetical protein